MMFCCKTFAKTQFKIGESNYVESYSCVLNVLIDQRAENGIPLSNRYAICAASVHKYPSMTRVQKT